MVKVEGKLLIEFKIIYFQSETDHIGSFLLEEIINVLKFRKFTVRGYIT